jgi:hypothetical protein
MKLVMFEDAIEHVARICKCTCLSIRVVFNLVFRSHYTTTWRKCTFTWNGGERATEPY